MAGLLIVTLLVSSICAISNLFYGILSLLITPARKKPDFDYIDGRNETRYLRYHYPEDKP